MITKKRDREGKRERGKRERKRGKEKEKGKQRKRKRERIRGKRKEIGKKEETDGFWLKQENKQNLFGEKIIFFPRGKEYHKFSRCECI